jgi:hypothetical protein
MDAFVTCFGTIVVLAIIFGFIAFLRYMNYKETLALAEKGLTRPDAKNSKGLLRWGVVITALGVALTLGLYPIGFFAGEIYPFRLGPWMLGGFVPLFLGLGLVLLHYLTEKN